MNTWFIATIILKCEIEGRPSIPGEWTCTQSIYLLRASDRDQAYAKALRLGNSQEVSYKNANAEVVTWKFIGLENIEELSVRNLRDETEIWGRVFHTQDPEAMIVEKSELSVYFNDEIQNMKAEEIIKNGQGTKLVCNRIKT